MSSDQHPAGAPAALAGQARAQWVDAPALVVPCLPQGKSMTLHWGMNEDNNNVASLCLQVKQNHVNKPWDRDIYTDLSKPNWEVFGLFLQTGIFPKEAINESSVFL